ncbi:MAG TPA: PfkB family carbohydrate kinase, partial [Acidimicrobiales bacterium]|nr:PfkB family carbohydrate kinase [Acidimicrobiales bacterium]
MTGPGGPLVVVGDALLDRDVTGRAERLSPDAPVPVLDEDRRSSRPGGAALAAALAAGCGAGPVVLVTAIGRDRAGDELRQLLEGAGIAVVDCGTAAPTPEKIRLRAGDQPLLRLDRGGRLTPPERLPAAAADAIGAAGAVLVSDYGRGVAAAADVRRAVAGARQGGPLVWDPHPRGPEPVAGASVVTPNRQELAAAGFVGGGDGLAGLARGAEDARRRWAAGAVVVTLGADGALLATGGGPPLAVPAPACAGGDVCGAGDRFAAATAVALRAGRVLSEAVVEAVAAASAFVAQGGASSVAARWWAGPAPAGQSPAPSPPAPGG